MNVENPVTQILLPAAVALVMFALGTTLGGDDLRRVLVRPRAFVLGLLAHALILPMVAFALGSLLSLPPETAVGLVIIAACPANAIASLFTHFARGDTMLAVSLSAAASLMSAATLPLFVNLALARFLVGPAEVRLPVLPSALGLFLISTLPVAAGMRVRQTRPALAARIEARMGGVGGAVVLVVIAAAVWSERRTVGPALLRAGLPALLLNTLAVGLAWGVSAAAGLARAQRVAVGLECGLQNFALAAFVCLTLLGRRDLLLPPIAYGLTMWLSAIAVVLLVRRQDRRLTAGPRQGAPRS
jgi:bile acid:Na+ symporter, BASS family